MKELSSEELMNVDKTYLFEGNSARSVILDRLDELELGGAIEIGDKEWDLKTPMRSAINGRFDKKDKKFTITKFRKLLNPDEKGYLVQRVI